MLSSSLAAISLLTDEKATLLARVSGVALTASVVRGDVLCGYRCTELSTHGPELTPRMQVQAALLAARAYPQAREYLMSHGMTREQVGATVVSLPFLDLPRKRS